jgi:mannose/fructose/N-acetylgalactosamine-specific phosphotransferase system component IIB
VTDKAAFSGWVRVDDRLIHGQVTVGWWQYLRYREIWVVDEAARTDAYLGDALRLAAPAGVEVYVMDVGEAIERLGQREAERPSTTNAEEPILMLLREPEEVLALVEGGASIEQVNVGNLASRPGSVRALKNVSLTAQQVAALDELAGRGIEVFVQLSPEEARVKWEVLRRRLLRRRLLRRP